MVTRKRKINPLAALKELKKATVVQKDEVKIESAEKVEVKPEMTTVNSVAPALNTEGEEKKIKEMDLSALSLI